MIETKETLLEKRLEEVIKKAMFNGSQLVSITEKWTGLDPLQFFRASNAYDRIFWRSMVDDFCLVGAGQAMTIMTEDNRFKQTEEQWQHLLCHAEIDDPYQIPGTGLTMLGGMAFDPLKRKTMLWRNFAANEFTIPKFLLTKNESSYYLTINVMVKQDDNPVSMACNLTKEALGLLRPTNAETNGTTIMKKTEIAPDEWKQIVKRATDEIRNHLAEKIVLAREMRLKLSKQANVADIIDKLTQTQTNSYVFAFEHGDDCFVGATPERLVKVENRKLLSTCLAGTAPRGTTKMEDEKIGFNLLHDRKNRDEHDFVVQMIKHAMQDYCTDVLVPESPVVYQLRNLQHLYTPVTATLKKGYSIFDIIKKLHPTPALGGAPKREALAFIREHELLDRGWYGAPIGWVDSNQNGEFAVAIRSGLVQKDEVSLFAGCGVVGESDPDSEFAETMIKFKPMLSVLEGEQ